MGMCKCNQASSIIRSDLYVANIDIEPKVANRKKLMRLKTINNIPLPEGAVSNIKGSAEKFIREKSSLFRTVISKDSVFDKAELRKHNHTIIHNDLKSEKSILNPLDKEKNIQCNFTEKNYSSRESKKIATVLLHHFFFYQATSSIMNYILDEINEFSINANAVLFNENDEGSCMFIVKSGQVELSDSNGKIKQILSEDGIFGELALIKQKTKRKYHAKTITELDCYMIEENVFLKVAGDLMGKCKYQFSFLNYIESSYKDNLQLFVFELNFDKGYCINDLNEIFGVVEGKLKVIDKKGIVLSTITTDEIYGLSILLESEVKKSGMKILVEEASKCFVLPYKAFVEVFGLNYQYELLYSYFKCSMTNSKFFSVFSNEINMNSLFELFKIMQYSTGQIVFSAFKERKIIMLLDGDLVYANSKKKAIQLGQVFGEEIVNEDNDQEKYIDDIIANKNSLVFECGWESFRTKAMINNISYNELIGSLKKMHLVNAFKETQLIRISSHMNKIQFSKEDVIIKGNEAQDKYYFCQRGIVKHIYNNKVIRYYNPNNSFGETYLLNDNTEQDTSEIIASSKKVVLYYIHKDIFFNLLSNPYVNSLIKTKLANENTEIFFKDLFNISPLHKGKRSNVYLVHNTLSLYAIKAIKFNEERDKQHIFNIINEKHSSIKLDHPFVIKYIKTLKAYSWCLFLEEYAYGITIDEYLDMNNPFEDKNHIKFYGGCLFIVLDYFRTIGIIHRDITLSNTIIDTSGYIKLLDFSSSKTIKSNTTKTIIGTPLFIAPEVLGGKGYSYSCDYWSVGVCLYYMYYGYYPFGAKAEVPGDVYKEILNKKLSFRTDSNKDKDIQELLNCLLNKNPNERYVEFNEIKRCAVFDDFNWELLIRRKFNPPFIPQVVKYTQQKLLQNCSCPFRIFLDSEKVEGYRNVSFRLNKDVVLGSNNDDKTVDPNWFNDF